MAICEVFHLFCNILSTLVYSFHLLKQGLVIWSFHSLIFKEDRLFVAYYCYKSQYISFPLHQKQYNGLLVVQHVHTFMGFIIVWCISSLRINPHGESTFPTFVYLFKSNSRRKICNACDRQTFSGAVDFDASVVHHESHHLHTCANSWDL